VTSGIEAEALPTVRELGMSVTAYGVLSRGLLGGSRPTGPRDFHTYLPRFTGENFQKNQKLIETLREIAASKNATPAQLPIAWVLSRGSDIVAGTRRLEEAIPPDAIAGTRYDGAKSRVTSWPT
jgi:pyridoxine 4-dehydrogenase